MIENTVSPKQGRDPRKSKGKKHSSIRTFFKVFGIIFLIAGFAVIGILGGTLFGYIDTANDFNVNDLKLNFTSQVYFIDPATNKPMEFERLSGEENRIWVSSDKIPDELKNAVVAIEDERFWKHHGFDLKRTTGAVLSYIFKHGSSYGGSTITQQLIKNITGDDDVSPRRKIQEIWRAINIEQQLSKDQILELYLNTIYLSQGCNGVQAAANTYFGKDVSQLTLAESACIAGITQYPSKYDPLLHPESNKTKQEVVLKKMLDLGYINEAQYDNAVNEKLNFKKGAAQERTSKQSYFVDAVVEDVINDLQKEKGYSKAIATKMLYSGGLKIYATVDPNVQASMDKVFRDNKNFPQIKGSVQPEASMLVIDPYTGEIKGIIGGRGEKTASRTLNRATQTLRQPGSSIKPIAVYAPALEFANMTPATVFDDAPVTFGGWSPKNYYEGFRGPSTIRTAIEQSMNIVAVRVLDKVGVDTSFNFLKNNLGITSLVDREKRQDGKTYSDRNLSSLSLGGLTDGISVEQLTAAYTPFINKGMYSRPRTYTKVMDHEDKVLLEKKQKANVAMSEQTAFLMTQMLKGVVDEGTATLARLANNMPTAGKTGTTSDDKDRWFVGFTPYYVGAVWFGYDDPKEIVLPTSNNPSVVLWKAVMQDIHKNLPVKQFEEPSGIVQASICIDSGKKATDLCYKDPRGSRVRTEYFKAGTVPSGVCTYHTSGRINEGSSDGSTEGNDEQNATNPANELNNPNAGTNTNEQGVENNNAGTTPKPKLPNEGGKTGPDQGSANNATNTIPNTKQSPVESPLPSSGATH